MQEEVSKVAKAFKRMSVEENDEFIVYAQAIATVSLENFTGKLLERGLDITRAIVEFSCELAGKK